jgi:hypothetical protein
MPPEPKLRGQARQRKGPYPLGEIPPSLAIQIGKRIVHRLAVGQSDITGDDFGTIFAQSIGGEHRGKPLGIADVWWQNCAWSVKTVKPPRPHTVKKIRVISGRNDVDRSFDIKDSHLDVAATGRGVLQIWNSRINQALSEYEDLRIFIMVRNMAALEFTLIEIAAEQYVPSEYRWEENKKGNFEGFDIQRNEHRFTSQAGGRQFTVIHHVPASAYRFRIAHKPGMLEQEHVLRLVDFQDDWIVPVTVAPVIPMDSGLCAPSI